MTLRRILMLLSLLCAAIAVGIADDFDDMGNLTVRFLKSPGVETSVCHRTFIYQNGVEIYNNRWR